MSLMDKLPGWIVVRTTMLDTKEEELKKLIEECRFLLKGKNSKEEVNWKKYDQKTEKISERIEGYSGRLKNYFEKKIEDLKDRERMLWGYEFHGSLGI